MILSTTGYLQVHAYTSDAQIPLKDTAIAITDMNGRTIAMGLTNSSGQLDTPVTIIVPDLSAGLTPGTGTTPYSSVNLYAKKEDFEEIFVENVQVFPNTITLQPLQLIPNAELPAAWNKAESFLISAQNL